MPRPACQASRASRREAGEEGHEVRRSQARVVGGQTRNLFREPRVTRGLSGGQPHAPESFPAHPSRRHPSLGSWELGDLVAARSGAGRGPAASAHQGDRSGKGPRPRLSAGSAGSGATQPTQQSRTQMDSAWDKHFLAKQYRLLNLLYFSITAYIQYLTTILGYISVSVYSMVVRQSYTLQCSPEYFQSPPGTILSNYNNIDYIP